MIKTKNPLAQYKTEIKNGFEEVEPGNNKIIEFQKLSDYNKVMNSKKKFPFIDNTIKSLTAQKKLENDDTIAANEYISFLDAELNDIESPEGLRKIFSVFCDGNQNSFSWTKFPLIVKELGDDKMANKLLKLIEQANLYTKDINFKEFSEVMNTENENEKKYKNKYSSEDYEDMESYKQRKQKRKKKVEEDEEGTISSKNSKNEDDKKVEEDNEWEKSSKRYHRRYRENKTKNDNNENGNSTNKIHSKYRKKK